MLIFAHFCTAPHISAHFCSFPAHFWAVSGRPCAFCDFCTFLHISEHFQILPKHFYTFPDISGGFPHGPHIPAHFLYISGRFLAAPSHSAISAHFCTFPNISRSCPNIPAHFRTFLAGFRAAGLPRDFQESSGSCPDVPGICQHFWRGSARPRPIPGQPGSPAGRPGGRPG